MEWLLEVEDAWAGYGRVDVLRGVQVRVGAGEIVTILGANGAGKTTLIRCIMGLNPLRRGSIRFAGRPIHTLKPHQRHALGIGVVPEGKRLFPKMTVLENLLMGAYFQRDPRAVREQLDFVMDLFPRLRERAHQAAGTLSGGEQSMVAIARGLMSRPRLLIMDEPSFGLAPLVVREVFRLTRTIHEAGTSILLVEQNAWQALQVAQRGYVLQKGEVVLEGPTHVLREDPRVQHAYLRA
ncbi:MAG TPA: ABC transporter ATP-binding protein [Limnochordales bacterium]